MASALSRIHDTTIVLFNIVSCICGWCSLNNLHSTNTKHREQEDLLANTKLQFPQFGNRNQDNGNIDSNVEASSDQVEKVLVDAIF